jgi:hypothetical protein
MQRTQASRDPRGAPRRPRRPPPGPRAPTRAPGPPAPHTRWPCAGACRGCPSNNSWAAAGLLLGCCWAAATITISQALALSPPGCYLLPFTKYLLPSLLFGVMRTLMSHTRTHVLMTWGFKTANAYNIRLCNMKLS